MSEINMTGLSKSIPYTRSMEHDSMDPVYEQFLTFDTKESYLLWRTAWKSEYAEISQNIRTLRKEWRAEGQVHEDARHHRLFWLRSMARAMLELRKASKRKSQALYLAAREVSAVA